MKRLVDGIIGMAVGDALGVPVEFIVRKELKKNPVTDMREYGTHMQPKGTWSDDTSFTLCLVDSLKNGLHYQDIMDKFLACVLYGKYTPYGKLFDIGITTSEAIFNYRTGIEPLKCGKGGERENGNGSLMRILPIAYYLIENDEEKKELKEQMEIIHNISSLTHRHIRSLIGCGIYIRIAIELIKAEMPLKKAIEKGIKTAKDFYLSQDRFAEEFQKYDKRIGNIDDFSEKKEEEIKSSGYIVDTLEASIWCLLQENSYEATVLRAVNLGDDTDTVGAVTGGLAGIYYQLENIPKKWLTVLAQREYLIELCKE